MTKWIDKLKIGVFKKRHYDKSYKIYVTLNVALNEKEFQNLTNFKKIYRHEILDEFGYDLLKDSEDKAQEFISKKIIESNTDLIIGNAIWNLSDVLSIEKKINKANKSIDRIYIPSVKRREKVLAESKDTYNNHSRWIDEPPGRLEELYDKFTTTLDGLKKELKKTNIQVIEL